jgi:hypothetical protein
LIAVADHRRTPDAIGGDAPAVPLALRAQSLRKRFGEIEAVRSVSFFGAAHGNLRAARSERRREVDDDQHAQRADGV